MVEIMRLLGRPVDPAQFPDIPLEANPWWKPRKWASRITLRMYEKFGQPKNIPDDAENVVQLKQFAGWFDTNLSVPILEATLNVLRLVFFSKKMSCCHYHTKLGYGTREGKNGGYLTNRIQTHCFHYMTLA
jgi:hypothetical protein